MSGNAQDAEIKEIMKSYQDRLMKIYNHFSKEAWIGAFASFIAGFLGNIYMIINHTLDNDYLDSFNPRIFSIGQGRWLWNICGVIITPFNSAMFSAILLMLLFALFTLFLLDSFEIKSKIFAVIAGIFVSVSPVVCCFMTYGGGSFLFAIGLPFAILAVREYDKGVKGLIIAAICSLLTIVGYQPTIAVLIALFYSKLTLELFDEKVDIKKWIIKFLKVFGLLIISVVLYVITNNIAGLFEENATKFVIGVTTKEVEAFGYEAAGDASNLHLTYFVSSMVLAYKNFLRYAFNIFFDGSRKSVLNYLLVFTNIILTFEICYFTLKRILKDKNILLAAFRICVLLAAPLCLNAMPVMFNGKGDEQLRMMYSIVIAIIFAIGMIIKNISYMKMKNLILDISIVMLILHIICNLQIINDNYVRIVTFHDETYALMNRVVDRVEQLPEWDEGCRKLYFDYGEGGCITNEENYWAFKAYDDYVDLGWLQVQDHQLNYYWDNYNTSIFCRVFTGLIFETPKDAEIEKIKNSDEYMEMKIFPSRDAVKAINGVVVVKMDE